MKPVSGHPPSDPRLPSIEEQSRSQEPPEQSAGVKRSLPTNQQDLQGEQSKRQGTAQGRMHTNRINPLQQQWLRQLDTKPVAPAATAGSERTKDPLQPLSHDNENRLSPEQEQYLLAWASSDTQDSQLPLSHDHEYRLSPEQEQDLFAWASSDMQDSSLPLIHDHEYRLSPEQEQDLFAWASSDMQDSSLPLSLDHEYRLSPEQEQHLLAWASVEVVDEATATNVAIPRPQPEAVKLVVA